VSLAAMAQDFRILLDKLKSHDLLDNTGQRALMQAIAQLDAVPPPAKRGKHLVEAPWELRIPSAESLLFVPSTEDDRLQPDLFCFFSGPSNDEWPWKEQSLVIRIWSNDSKLSSRKKWDSKEVSEALRDRKWTRVLIRVHLDKAIQGDPAPLHHMQVGGVPVEEDRELCWIPPQLRMPRFPYHPMDIILACEIVVANFFPREFSRLRDDYEWQAVVIRAQERTLAHHSRICHDFCLHPDIHGKQTLLMRFWNT